MRPGSTNAPSRSTTTSPLRGGVSTPRTRESNRIEVATPSRAATRALTSATRFFQLSIGWQAPLDADSGFMAWKTTTIRWRPCSWRLLPRSACAARRQACCGRYCCSPQAAWPTEPSRPSSVLARDVDGDWDRGGDGRPPAAWRHLAGHPAARLEYVLVRGQTWTIDDGA